jgi:hypothetical protein
MSILSIAAIMLATITPASAQNTNQTTFRDGRGTTIGTSSVDSYGTTTFRNTNGQITGTATGPRR